MMKRVAGSCAMLAAVVVLLSSRTGTAQPAPAPAPAADPTLAGAKQHFEAGKVAYNAGDYINAIREFKAAEQLRPSPILDYNIGLANEKLGKRRVAVKYYRRYLESMPTAPNRKELETTISTLEAQIAASTPAGQQPPPQQVEQPGDMPPQQPQQQPAYGYDPYAGQGGQQGYVQPYQQPRAAAKRSYWWVALIVVGGVAVLTTIVVVAVIYGSPSYSYYATGLTSANNPGTNLLRAAEPTALVRGAPTVPVLQWRF